MNIRNGLKKTMASDRKGTISFPSNSHVAFIYRKLVAAILSVPLKCMPLANKLLCLSSKHASLARYRWGIFHLLEKEAKVYRRDGCRKSVYNYWLKRYNDKVSIDEAMRLVRTAQQKPSFLYIVNPTAKLRETLSTIRSLRQQSYNAVKIIFPATKHDKRITEIRDAAGPLDIITPNRSIAEYVTDDDLIIDISPGDDLSVNALLEIALYVINSNEEWDVAYFDEDTKDISVHYKNPFFKPDYSPVWFSEFDYISGACVLRARTYLQLTGGNGKNASIRTLILQNPKMKIVHLNQLLLHKNKERRGYIPKSVATYRNSRSIIEDNSLVSIIIPTKDNVQYLRRCIDSILRKPHSRHFQIIIVNNGSENVETYQYLKEIASISQIETIEYPYEFNYSAINNYAVKYAKGEYLVFVNDDTEVVSPDWLDKMISWLRNDNVGCIGAKLLYPKNTIQHIGVAIGVGTAAMHYYNGEPTKSRGYFDMNLFPREVSAVTAACLGIRKSTYLKSGGFDERIPVAFNDVELCTRLRGLGYENMIDPSIVLYHYESRSRGYDDNDFKHIRSLQERNYYIQKTKMDVRYDPYYARSLSIINPYCLSFPPRVLSRIAISEMSAKPYAVLLGSIRRQGDDLRNTIIKHAIKLRGMGYSTIVGVDVALSRTGDTPDFELVFNERDAADMIRKKLARYVIVYSESFNRLIWFLPEEVEVFIFQSNGCLDSSDDTKVKLNDLERIPIEKYGMEIVSIDEFILHTTGRPDIRSSIGEQV